MKTAGYISIIAIANILLASVRGFVPAAEQEKSFPKQRDAVSIKGNSKKAADHSAQWTADPDRGWVSSEESRGVRGGVQSWAAPKQMDRKSKGARKARKRF